MTRDLTITAPQAELLRQTAQAAERAIEARNLVFSAVVRGHGLAEATLVRLDGTTLTVAVPEPAAEITPPWRTDA